MNSEMSGVSPVTTSHAVRLSPLSVRWDLFILNLERWVSPTHHRFAGTLNFDRITLNSIILSHWHDDHVGGVNEVLTIAEVNFTLLTENWIPMWYKLYWKNPLVRHICCRLQLTKMWNHHAIKAINYSPRVTLCSLWWSIQTTATWSIKYITDETNYKRHFVTTGKFNIWKHVVKWGETYCIIST